MCTRAVHIEAIEMNASSFINALRRFFAIRGPAKQIRLDCGTKFVGASRGLKIDETSSSSESVQKYLKVPQCIWVFNTHHASHMGAAWERMIGIARRILDCMLLQEKCMRLTHEVLIMLMAEVTAVMNARPLSSLCLRAQNRLSSSLQLRSSYAPPPGDFGNSELLKEEWKQVQRLD